MENKYYIPEIEEFHVGFEYEYEWFEYGRKIWIDEIANQDDILQAYTSYEETPDDYINEYRVKYLDQEDIESLGFMFNAKILRNEDNELIFYKNVNFSDIVNENKKIIEEKAKNGIVLSIIGTNVTINNWLYPEKLYFTGTIKNKSELKRLLKQLNIN